MDWMLPFIRHAMAEVVRNGGLDIRDVDGGQPTFLYSSGWRGLIYVMIKGMVSFQRVMNQMANLTAIKIAAQSAPPKFVAGNVTGGLIPGWLISRYLETLTIPTQFVYVSGTRNRVENPQEAITCIQPWCLQRVAQALATEIMRRGADVKFVAGATPQGMILGYLISELLIAQHPVRTPFMYVRPIRKKGGHKEKVTGLGINPLRTSDQKGLAVGLVTDFERSGEELVSVLAEEGFSTYNVWEFLPEDLRGLVAQIERPLREGELEGQEVLVVEELVNTANTTSHSIDAVRRLNAIATTAATLLSYDTPLTNHELRKNDIRLVSLFTLGQLVEVAGVRFPENLVEAARDFVRKGADVWCNEREIERDMKGGTM